MKCTINDTIDTSLKKGKKMEVIRRYIKMKYHISIDPIAFRERVRTIRYNFNMA